MRYYVNEKLLSAIQVSTRNSLAHPLVIRLNDKFWELLLSRDDFYYREVLFEDLKIIKTIDTAFINHEYEAVMLGLTHLYKSVFWCFYRKKNELWAEKRYSSIEQYYELFGLSKPEWLATKPLTPEDGGIKYELCLRKECDIGVTTCESVIRSLIAAVHFFVTKNYAEQKEENDRWEQYEMSRFDYVVE